MRERSGDGDSLTCDGRDGRAEEGGAGGGFSGTDSFPHLGHVSMELSVCKFGGVRLHKFLIIHIILCIWKDQAMQGA